MTSTVTPPVSAIADVLALWGMRGWLTPPLQPVVGATAARIATARTLQFTHAPSGPGMTPVYEILSGDLTDVALVLAGAADVPGAVWGEILSTAAQQRGAAAVLVEGAVRDVPELIELGLPIYAESRNVVGPAGLGHLVAVDTSVRIADSTISSGDTIVIDAMGCVRIAAELAHTVLDAAARYAEAEDSVLQDLRGGAPMNVAYRHKSAVVDLLRSERPQEVVNR